MICGGKRISIIDVARNINYGPKEPSEDSNIRKEMHLLISTMVTSGKSKEEILEKLSQDQRFAKYSMHFESYINDKMCKKVSPKKSEEEEEISL